MSGNIAAASSLLKPLACARPPERLGSTPGADARALLPRIAAAYQSITDYRAGVDIEISEMPSQDPKTRIRLLLAGSKPRRQFSDKQVVAPVSHRLLLGTDGQTIWGYSPREKKYVRETVGNAKTAEASALEENHFRYFTRFELLDRMNVTVENLGEKNQSDGKQKVKCIVLRLTPASDEKWSEVLWVDLKSHLVLKSVFQETKLFRKVTTKAVWNLVQLSGDVDPALFVFTPPPNAMRVNALAIW